MKIDTTTKNINFNEDLLMEVIITFTSGYTWQRFFKPQINFGGSTKTFGKYRRLFWKPLINKFV